MNECTFFNRIIDTRVIDACNWRIGYAGKRREPSFITNIEAYPF